MSENGQRMPSIPTTGKKMLKKCRLTEFETEQIVAYSVYFISIAAIVSELERSKEFIKTFLRDQTVYSK